MSRITGRFEQLAAAGRRALIPYIVAGDPSPETTVALMHVLVEAGADVIELGVPFSDPMSEGPVIARAHERALAKGVRLRDVLRMVTEFRAQDQATPVLLMGYANPLERMGFPAFADAAALAGVDAILTVDIPPEEVTAVNNELKRVGIDNIFLISPTTPDERIGFITAQASGFIYYVAVKGVTGAGNLDTEDVAAHLSRIRAHTTLPLAVGFGIKDALSARAVAQVADAVVVGSALVERIAAASAQEASFDEIAASAAAMLTEIHRGMISAELES